MHTHKNPWTSAGVHLHSQQQPSAVLKAGNPKTSAANFQSCRTCTNAPLMSSLAVFRHLSVLFQAEPSCLSFGHMPVARIVRDHLMIMNTSSHVSLHILLWGNTTRGILRCWKSPTPGKDKLSTSMLSLLSHWVGAPSPQIPTPSNCASASVSQFLRCTKLCGSI